MTQQQPSPNPGFTPNWRYNPVKHQLQLWVSPVQCAAFEEETLMALEEFPIPPAMTLAQAMHVVEMVATGRAPLQAALGLGGWRNTARASLLKLPPSTR